MRKTTSLPAGKLTWEQDPIGDRLDELADLGEVYRRNKAANHEPVATRCAMLRLVGEIYDLASQSIIPDNPDHN